MNMLAQFNQNQKTMSSREIAQLCEKRHDHVLRDIRAYVGAVVQMERGIDVRSMDWGGKEGVQLFGDTSIGGVTYAIEINQQNKQPYPVYHLDKSATLTIVSGYNILLRKRIIDRWQELESQAQSNSITLPNFADPAEAAIAWANEYKAKQIAQEQLAITAPKAQALDTIANTANTYTIRECVKAIGGIREKDLIQLLIDRKWIYRDATKKLQPCAQYVINGVFLNRTSPVITNAYDGQERVFLHMRVTAFGLTRIAGLVNKNRVVAA